MPLRSLAVLLLALALSPCARAQTGAPADSLGEVPSDARVVAALDALGLVYETEPNGDYRVAFDFDDGRGQTVWIRPATSRYDSLEVRDVFSIAYLPTEGVASPVPGLAARLLEENASLLVGAWASESGGLIFLARVDADAPPAVLSSVMDLTMVSADELDGELNGGDLW